MWLHEKKVWSWFHRTFTEKISQKHMPKMFELNIFIRYYPRSQWTPSLNVQFPNFPTIFRESQKVSVSSKRGNVITFFWQKWHDLSRQRTPWTYWTFGATPIWAIPGCYWRVKLITYSFDWDVKFFDRSFIKVILEIVLFWIILYLYIVNFKSYLLLPIAQNHIHFAPAQQEAQQEVFVSS